MAKLIAEFCQNHNGDFDLLTKMVVAAAESGATHGKMQTIFANTAGVLKSFTIMLIHKEKKFIDRK